MELKDIERDAKALMTLHGVGHLKFTFDNAKSRLGSCSFRRVTSADGRRVWMPVTISLSKNYCALLPDDEIREVVLHEIAHAKAGRHAGHGWEWKVQARALGIAGDRCATPSARPAHTVEGRCSICDKVISEGHRLPLRVYFHGKCGLTLATGLVTYYKNGSKVSLQTMPTKYRAEYMRINLREVARS